MENNSNITLRDRYRGCMIGGAVGDALGVPVEFLLESQIFERYGVKGITSLGSEKGKVIFSDDTQMSLFTAAGLLSCSANEEEKKNYIPYIADAYRDWLQTQRQWGVPNDETKHSWLRNIPELYYRCAPGKTCIESIVSGCKGTIETPINRSKGCGGVMRVAPVGLYLGASGMTVEMVDRVGAEAAALTHGHDLGFIPAAALVHIINLLVHKEMTLSDAVNDSIQAMKKMFLFERHMAYFIKLMQTAVELSSSEIEVTKAIHKLGTGWVAEETLAIAVYCSLRFPNNFENAIVASVNHNGDSDSTGAVTGNIMGALLGVKAISNRFTDNLKLKNVVLEMADDLYDDRENGKYRTCTQEEWKAKYVTATFIKY